MGDYLKCYRCDSCGAQFIVNRDPHYKFYSNEHYCPACHFSLGVKGDDSLLKAMVSEEQLQNTKRIQEVLKENEALEPLKAFINVPCEICGKPITEWTEGNVKIAVDGSGWGHTNCWNSDIGKLRLMLRLAKWVQSQK